MKRCVIDVDACLVRAPDARYKRHGVSRSYRLADFDVLSLADARKQARDVRARVQLGADPQSERLAERQRARQTVAGVCTLFLEKVGPTLSR